MKYYAWIPNTIGRLSFSFAGITDYPTRVICEHNFRSGGRYFAGYQRRDLSDTNLLLERVPLFFKLWVDKQIHRKDGDFQFCILMKKSASADYVKGRIHIFRRTPWKQIESAFKEKLKLVPNQFEETTNLEAFFGQDIFLKSSAAIKFKLKRNGELICEVEKIDADLKGSTNASQSGLEHIIASQTYFFIRDLFHKHRFHAPSSDTVLDVYSNSTDWKKNVCHALARKAIALRRQQTLTSLAKAAGVTTYLKSFVGNIMSSRERKREPLFDLNSFENSLAFGKNLVSIKPKSGFRHFIRSSINSITVMATLLLSYFNILNRNFVNQAKEGKLVELLTTFFQIEYVLGVMITVVLLQFLKYGLNDNQPDVEDFAANFTRYALVLPRTGFPLFVFCSSLIIVAIGICTVGYMFFDMLSPR